jgi:hypothetical protein
VSFQDLVASLDGLEKTALAIKAQRDALFEACRMLLDRTANPITDHAFYTLEDAREKAIQAMREAK